MIVECFDVNEVLPTNENILHFRNMRYFAPLNVVIQQRDIFGQNAEVVEFLSSSPGRTRLEEEVQVLFTPTEKIKK